MTDQESTRKSFSLLEWRLLQCAVAGDNLTVRINACSPSH